ncbi:hypothetical protein [Photobacterium sanguinicancri]|uniref:Uncharacterized protein n=1 Tax=Photobacterium sanguinicancri TaxID=875932 RepID=A0AAW7Y3N4_9GAMM|nr:hypothetical protein [Photobacterium sanguinicancri]MDO6498575.1 hypothetical protein [Photobacterium sanguinicancri]MDO6542977.1 hypothetical protein [Photobacterium sanguinicancri]
MYTIFSLLKWVVLIYLVKTGRIHESVLIKCQKFTLAAMTLFVINIAAVSHVVESVDLVSKGIAEGYIQRRV